MILCPKTEPGSLDLPRLLTRGRSTTDPLRLAVRTLCLRSQGSTILGSSCSRNKSDKCMSIIAHTTVNISVISLMGSSRGNCPNGILTCWVSRFDRVTMVTSGGERQLICFHCIVNLFENIYSQLCSEPLCSGRREQKIPFPFGRTSYFMCRHFASKTAVILSYLKVLHHSMAAVSYQ